MNTEQFEKSVQNKANQNVQQKIATFKESLKKALNTLTGSECLSKDYYCYISPDGCKANKEIFQLFINGDTISPNDWPKFLWEKEQKEVREKLFGMMDIMQRAV